MDNSISFSKNSPSISSDSSRDIFRQYLRQADKLIIEEKFDEAKIQVAEAKKIEPRNPFIIAFEERISLFESKKSHGQLKHKPGFQATADPIKQKPPISPKLNEENIVSREMLEQKLRQQIESEYKSKYTQELRKAEEHAAKALAEEHEKLEHQRQTLKVKFEHQIEEARKQLEQQYQTKLDEEVAKSEERLNQQHEVEIAFIENEMKKELVSQYENDLRSLEQRYKHEQGELLAREHSTLQEQERLLETQFNQKLREVLNDTETAFHDQNWRQLEIEREKIKEELALEFKTDIEREKQSLSKEFNETKIKQEESFQEKQKQLYADVEKKVKDQFDLVRATEEEKFEKKYTAVRKELESEFQLKYERKAAEEHEKIQAEAEKIIEAEKNRLENEIVKAGKRLEEQHLEKTALIKNKMKAEMNEQYESEIKNLQKKFKKEQEELLAKEKQAFNDREQSLKDEFNRKLLESLRKTETLFQEQSRQQLQMEREKIEAKLRDEFKERFSKEEDALRQQFDAQKVKLEESYSLRQIELNNVIDKRVQEQLRILQDIEEEKFAQKRIAYREELEKEFQKKFEIQIDEERRKIQVEAEARIEAEKKKYEAEYEQMIQQQNEQIQKIRIDLRNEMEQAFLSRLERIAEEYDNKMDLLGAKVPESKTERVALYKIKMLECYQSGQPSVDGARALMQLKELLELTFDDHLVIESDVRLELYSKNLEKKILSGQIEARNIEALDSLKQQFNITPEEATKLEPYIISCFQRHATKGRLLVVDDDLLLLKSLEDILVDCDYHVLTAPDINSALELLQSQSFDLILSDIKFGPGELDGFKFFKAVQEQENLRNIPFVFMSALQDGVIIRSGVQLGVDDYLTKPMDPDLLIATIEGKLRRYRSMRLN